MIKNKKLTSEQIEEVVSMYPNHNSKEINAATGVSRRSITRLAAKYGLKKQITHREECLKGWEWLRKNNPAKFKRLEKRYKEVLERITTKNITDNMRLLSSEQRAAMIRKRADTLKEIYKKEAIREKYGMKRQTKLQISTATDETKHIRKAKKALQKRGYICEQIGKEVFYTTETKRTQRERHFAEKYGFVFKKKTETKEMKNSNAVVIPDWTDKQGGMNIF